MVDVEFKAWNKITRNSPFTVTITEKIDGTNGCIIVKDNKVVGVQSRKRLITPENDNYKFAAWVEEHAKELGALGDGYHYGEWAGYGIQKNPLQLERKHFFLFNTYFYSLNKPACCDVVPVLYEGELQPDTIPDLLEELSRDSVTHEGVVVYYHTFKDYTKHTIKNKDGKWCKSKVVADVR